MNKELEFLFSKTKEDYLLVETPDGEIKSYQKLDGNHRCSLCDNVRNEEIAHDDLENYKPRIVMVVDPVDGSILCGECVDEINEIKDDYELREDTDEIWNYDEFDEQEI